MGIGSAKKHMRQMEICESWPPTAAEAKKHGFPSPAGPGVDGRPRPDSPGGRTLAIPRKPGGGGKNRAKHKIWLQTPGMVISNGLPVHKS